MPISKREIDHYVDVRDWMQSEVKSRLQLGAFTMLAVQAKDRRRRILGDQLPDNWKEFNRLYTIAMTEKNNADDDLRLKTGQLALVGTTLAMTGYILDRVTSGANLQLIAKSGFGVMDAYIDRIRSANRRYELPTPRTLDAPTIHDALGESSGRSSLDDSADLLQASTGLTLRAISQLFPGRDAVLPAPGHPVGDVEPWWQPRLERQDLAQAEERFRAHSE